MKKIIYVFIGIVSALAVFGCNKFNPEFDSRKGSVTLKAYVSDNITTKSAYSLVGDTYQFSWVASDKFTVQTYDGSSLYSADVFTTSTGGRSSVSFTGDVTDGYTLQNYAFYPNDGTGETYNFKNKNVAISPITPGVVGSEVATVTLPSVIVEDKAHPMAHIPMIGVKDGSGNYAFTPATGVLKITIKDLPTTACRILLRQQKGEDSYSGDFVFDTNYAIRKGYVKSGAATLQLNFTNGEAEEDRSFFIPLPTGTYAANTFGIYVYDGSNYWHQGNPASDLTVTQGQVLELPPVTYIGDANVSIIGTSSVPKARVKFAKDQFIIFKITETSTTPTEHFEYNDYEGGKLSYAQTWTISGGSSSYFKSQSTSGLKYFHYKIINSDNSTYVSSYVQFYYLTSADETKYTGTYTHAWSNQMSPSELAAKGDASITFVTSDNPARGNIMITKAFGFCYDVSESTHTTLSSYDYSQFTDGNPIYGFYNPASGAPQLVFSNTTEQVFYRDAGNHPHFITEYGSNQLRFAFDSSAYNSTQYDLICWGGYIMNCYDDSSHYDLYINQFCANKD